MKPRTLPQIFLAEKFYKPAILTRKGANLTEYDILVFRKKIKDHASKAIDQIYADCMAWIDKHYNELKPIAAKQYEERKKQWHK